MIITAGILILVIAAMIGGMLIVKNNREKADMVGDKAAAILEVLKK